MSFRHLHPDVERKCLELAGERPPIAATLTEKQFQSLVMDEARRNGWLAFHVHDSRKSAPGFPDATLVHPTRRLFIVRELKVGKNVLSDAQAEWIAALAAAGVDAGVWRPEMWPSIQATLRGVQCQS